MSVMQVHVVLLRWLLGHVSNIKVLVLISLPCFVILYVDQLLVLRVLCSFLVELCSVNFLRIKEADGLSPC